MDIIIFTYLFEYGDFWWVYSGHQEFLGFLWVDVLIGMESFVFTGGH